MKTIFRLKHAIVISMGRHYRARILLLLLLGFGGKSTSFAPPHFDNKKGVGQNQNPNPNPLPHPEGITLKLAMDRNGNIYSPSFTGRFTSGYNLDMVHRLRSMSDAVLVGAGTVVADDPGLGVRRGYENGVGVTQPVRVVVDPKLRTVKEGKGLDHNIFTNKDLNTFVIYDGGLADEEGGGEGASGVVDKAGDLDLDLDLEGVIFIPLSSTKANGRNVISPKNIADHLRTHLGFKHVMVEGGAYTGQSFLRSGVVDRAIIVRCDRVVFEGEGVVHSGIGERELEEGGLKKVHEVVKQEEGETTELWAREDKGWPFCPERYEKEAGGWWP